MYNALFFLGTSKYYFEVLILQIAHVCVCKKGILEEALLLDLWVMHCCRAVRFTLYFTLPK